MSDPAALGVLTMQEKRVKSAILQELRPYRPHVQLCIHPSRGRYFEVSLLRPDPPSPLQIGGIPIQWTYRD